MSEVPGFTFVHCSAEDVVDQLWGHERRMANALVQLMAVMNPKKSPSLASLVRGMHTLNSKMIHFTQSAHQRVSQDNSCLGDIVQEFCQHITGDPMVLLEKFTTAVSAIDGSAAMAGVNAVQIIRHYHSFLANVSRQIGNTSLISDTREQLSVILNGHNKTQARQQMNNIRFDNILRFGDLAQDRVSSYFCIDNIVHRSGEEPMWINDSSFEKVPVELLFLNLNSSEAMGYNALAVVRIESNGRQLAFPPFRVNEVSIHYGAVITLTALNYTRPSVASPASLEIGSANPVYLKSWYDKMAEIFPVQEQALLKPRNQPAMQGLGIGFATSTPFDESPPKSFQELYETPSPGRPHADELSPTVSMDSVDLEPPPAPIKKRTSPTSVYDESPCVGHVARLEDRGDDRPCLEPPVVVQKSLYKLPGGSEVDIANFGGNYTPSFASSPCTASPKVKRKSLFSLFKNSSKSSLANQPLVNNGSQSTLGSAKTITTANPEPKAPASPPQIVTYTSYFHPLAVNQLSPDWKRVFSGDAIIKLSVNPSVGRGWLAVCVNNETKVVIDIGDKTIARMATPREIHLHSGTGPSKHSMSVSSGNAAELYSKISDIVSELRLPGECSDMSLSSMSTPQSHSVPASKSSTLTSISTYGSVGAKSALPVVEEVPKQLASIPNVPRQLSVVSEAPNNSRPLLSKMKIRLSVQTESYHAIHDPHSWKVAGMYSLSLYFGSEASSDIAHYHFVLESIDGGRNVSWMVAVDDKAKVLEPIGRAGLLMKCSHKEIYMLECRGSKEYTHLQNLL